MKFSIGRSLIEVSSTVLLILVGFAMIELLIWVIGKIFLKKKNVVVAMLVIPAIIGISLLVVYPLLFELKEAFGNRNLYHLKNPEFSLAQGAKNFLRVFTQPVLKTQRFFPVMLRTFLWTFIQVFFHVTMGLMLALILNSPYVKLKNLYKGLLILPWAMPQVIAALTWRSEFHFDYGFFNIALRNIGLNPVQWKSSPLWNFVAMNLTNIWMGIPFMMVIALGGLQSISSEYYEAADMDGASEYQKLRNITLPLLKPVMAPAVMLGIIWTFNQFNIPFFINEMNLETSDILVTALFRAAFTFSQYGFAAAFAVVIFMVLFILSLGYLRVTGALKGVDE